MTNSTARSSSLSNTASPTSVRLPCRYWTMLSTKTCHRKVLWSALPDAWRRFDSSHTEVLTAVVHSSHTTRKLCSTSICALCNSHFGKVTSMPIISSILTPCMRLAITTHLGALLYAPDAVCASDTKGFASTLCCCCHIISCSIAILEARPFTGQDLCQLQGLWLLSGFPKILQAHTRTSMPLTSFKHIRNYICER